jgi:hypothetical protein
VRVTGGRLAQVKKNAGLLQRPLELWTRMFEAFPRLGEALCVPGWGGSLCGTRSTCSSSWARCDAATRERWS